MSLVVPEQGPVVVPAAVGAGLSDETRAMLAEAIPENTRRSYQTQTAAFRAWCEADDRPFLPSDADTVTEYVRHLLAEGRAPGSIDVAISVIRTMHRYARVEVPDTRDARLLIRGYRRRRADEGGRDRQAPPAVAADIRRMLDTLGDPAAVPDRARAQVLRDRVILLVGFGMFARRSELARLDLADVTETENGLVVYIARTKTDQAARGQERVLPYGARPDACPVRAVRAWRTFLAEQGIVEGPLLCRIDRHGRLGGRLSGQGVDLVLKRLGAAAGVGHLSGHSLRAGAATSAAEAGATTGQIEDGGGWAKGSTAVGRYVRQRDRWKNHPLADVTI
ncbi:site-specific integrase [Frankia tisae]|uniref:site-specific integrase n=1 Tax=Frankia tisae TaxID=2950104 RepID=UPI0021BEE8A6|nr:site-specific integrase [Frankia tisae]